MRRSTAIQWLRTLLFHGCALFLLSYSALFLVDYARAVSDAGEVSVPLVSELPVLERRLRALTEQVEMAELHAALRQGSQAERIGVYVLPREPDFDRLLGIFDVLGEGLRKKGVLQSLTQIKVGDVVQEGRGEVRPVHLSFTAHDDGLKTFLTFVQLAGLLTVGDALSEEERSILLQRTEEENPAGVVALEQFFSTDLLQYAQDSLSYEEQVLRSFSSATFLSAFRSILQSSALREARLFFDSDLGKVLETHNLWPFPFVAIDTIRVEKGNAPKWQKVSVQLLLYTEA
jgi:hypothetical protein